MSTNPFESPMTSEPGIDPRLEGAMTLKYIHPLQAGKVMALVQGLFGCIFLPFVLLGAFLDPQGGAIAGLMFGIALPLAYAVLGFVMGAIGALIYNFVARSVGGLRVNFE